MLTCSGTLGSSASRGLGPPQRTLYIYACSLQHHHCALDVYLLTPPLLPPPLPSCSLSLPSISAHCPPLTRLRRNGNNDHTAITNATESVRLCVRDCVRVCVRTCVCACVPVGSDCVRGRTMLGLIALSLPSLVTVAAAAAAAAVASDPNCAPFSRKKKEEKRIKRKKRIKTN